MIVAAWVRTRPVHWRAARYLISDISDLSFENDGGADLLRGYVLCDALQEGEPLHVCPSKGKSHTLHVYILRQDNEDIFPALLSKARDRKTT